MMKILIIDLIQMSVVDYTTNNIEGAVGQERINIEVTTFLIRALVNDIAQDTALFVEHHHKIVHNFKMK